LTVKKFFENSESKKFIDEGNFGAAAHLLLENQKQNWQRLAAGYKSLETVVGKTFYFNGFRIKVQFNPGRIISSSAKVDAASIKERECFLCIQNLPEQQRGIPYSQYYFILANPFPIFPEHFTIPQITHIPQQILGKLSELLKLSRDLSNGYVVFYNGPKCGASAPDHFHFQAGNKGFMTIDDDFHQLKNEYGATLIDDADLTLTAVDDGLRRFISIESTDFNMINDVFEKFYLNYSLVVNSTEEPMMNILSYYEVEFGWRVIVFLRSKHRSSHYFAEGKKNILLSAAAVDFGGVCILPLEKDFIKITKEDLTEIFNEIGISKDNFEFIKQKLANQK